jgi:hypothetical protein
MDCPNCKAHLALIKDSTTTSADAAAAPRQQLVPATFLNLDPTDAELHWLKYRMCFPYNTSASWKPTQPTMRPIASKKEDEVELLKDGRERQTLDRVARTMHATIRVFGEESARTLLKSRQRARSEKDPLVVIHTVLEAVGAILYPMEWTSDEPRIEDRVPASADADTAVMGSFEPGYVLERPSIHSTLYELRFWRLFELMLVIDYGFPAHPICGSSFGPGLHTRIRSLEKWAELENFFDYLVGIARRWRWRQGVPDDKSWGLMADAMSDWPHNYGLGVPVWDVATMIYYYRRHQKPSEIEEGWIG